MGGNGAAMILDASPKVTTFRIGTASCVESSMITVRLFNISMPICALCLSVEVSVDLTTMLWRESDRRL
jgi:hypothetical protein